MKRAKRKWSKRQKRLLSRVLKSANWSLKFGWIIFKKLSWYIALKEINRCPQRKRNKGYEVNFPIDKHLLDPKYLPVTALGIRNTRLWETLNKIKVGIKNWILSSIHGKMFDPQSYAITYFLLNIQRILPRIPFCFIFRGNPSWDNIRELHEYGPIHYAVSFTT